MTSFIIYSIEIGISLGLFYAVYWLFLRNDTFFKLNRMYLLSTVTLSLLMPLLNITLVPGEHSFLGRHLFLPIEHYKQQISGAADYTHLHFPRPHHHTHLEDANSQISDAASSSSQASSEATAEIAPAPASDVQQAGTTETPTDWPGIITVIYFSGVAIFFLRFLSGFLIIYSYSRKNES